MLFILDRSFNVIDNLSITGDISKMTPFFDDLLTEDLATGAETYKLEIQANLPQASSVIVGNYIAFRQEKDFKLFTIIETDESHSQDNIKSVYCEMTSIELINNELRPNKYVSVTAYTFLESILANTDWQLGIRDIGLSDVKDIDITDYTSVYEAIQEHVVKGFGAEIRYRVEIQCNTIVGKFIDIFIKRGKTSNILFSYTKNMTSVSRKTNLSNLVTALIGVGKNNITFRDIETPTKPAGQDFIVSEEAYRRWNRKGKHIIGTEKFDTESEHELLKLTAKKLEERVNPQVKYELKVELLGDKVAVGDTVRVVDHEFNPPLYLEARVSQLKTSKTNPQNDEVVLSNFKEINSNISDEMRQIANQLEGYIDGQFPIGGDKIQNGAIGKEQFSKQYHTEIVADAVHASLIKAEELVADKATIEELKATNAKIDNLEAENVEITGNLTAVNAQVENLIAENVNIAGNLDAVNANIMNLQANKADITQLNAIKANISDLEAETAKIGILEADVAEIDNLLAGNITADNIAANTITADKLAANTITAGSGVIANGAIGNAQISSLSANKIDSGEIDTSKIKIIGQNGFLFIENNTLYVVDSNRQIRCELGVIENNTNYGFIVRGSDGQTILLDHNGVRNAGITDGAVDNRTISENANISGKKLDINSVIRTINEDGTIKIEGTKVVIGDKTLDLTLSEQNNLITEHTKKLETQQSSIAANTNAIKLKVDKQTYDQDKNAQTESLIRHESSISILQSQIINKVESIDISNALDEYGNVVDTKINNKISKLEQTDESIKLSVNENKEKLKDSKNFIINSQALFTIEGFEPLGGEISRYEHSEIGEIIVEVPEIPEQEETPPIDKPSEPVVTPPTNNENTNTKPPTEVVKPPAVSTTYSTKIHFINNGKTGDCILIQTDNGKNIMIDSNYKSGAEKVVSYLNHLGVKKLDYIIVSHFHTDHAEGFPYIMDNINVKGAKAYYRLPDFTKLPAIETEWKTPECWNSFRLKCNEKGVNRYENLTEKQRIVISNTSYLEFYNTQFANYLDYNSLSLVVLFVHGNKKYLLTGDIHTTAQANLLGKIGKVDMAKVPHHGYNSTINESWVKELNPRCWITTRTYGWENAYRDVGMLQVLGYPNYVQYATGSHIVLTSTGNDFTLDTSRKFLFGNCWCKYNNDNNLWYWFKQGGNIAKNETVIIQGKKYKFDSKGLCTNPYNPE